MLSGKDVGARLLTRCLLLLYAVPGLLSSSLFEFKEEACDGSMMLIRCPSGTTVDVQNAIYGQAKSGSMLCPMMTGEEAGYQDTGCPTNPAFQKVVNMCQGRQSCRVRVSWESFGIDPCPGLVKNLEIHYKCKPGKLSREFIDRV
ncbi:PREDICTED: D-galactoside-specific lectin-like isoform X2 [Priapulus caudatus]|uniref:D-galactoside-specific lectin-like isoform X2 n=1 Tax=Priapulus caudatus TaxID=37621 RepID=A0ABM1EVV7_PRICU|nr:PREDICTED: D-galactoside-specific lectin-like isoform X2 [Priapulus caudatus]